MLKLLFHHKYVETRQYSYMEKKPQLGKYGIYHGLSHAASRNFLCGHQLLS